MNKKQIEETILTSDQRWREPKGTGEGISEKSRMSQEIMELRELLKYQNIVDDPRGLKFLTRLVRSKDTVLELHFDSANFAADEFERLLRGKRKDLGYTLPEPTPTPPTGTGMLFSVEQINSANVSGRVEGLNDALEIIKSFAREGDWVIEDNSKFVPVIKAVEQKARSILENLVCP